MPGLVFLLSSTAFLLFFGVPSAANDLKIVTRQSLNGRYTYSSTQYLSSSASRFQSANGIDNIAGHHTATIVHYGESTNQNFLLDLDAHEYKTYETDKRGIMLGAKSYPARLSGGQVDIWIESKDTGERQQMYDHTARHIITTERGVPGAGSCSTASETEIDGWYIDYSVLPEWRRPRGITFAFLTGGNCRDKIQVHRSGVELGFPLKTTTTSRSVPNDRSQPPVTSVSVSEVVELSEAPLDPALFQVPADFRQVKELTYMNQSLTAWDRFKSWVSGVFR